MPSNPKSLIRKILPTAHRVLTERFIKKELPKLNGRILVIGAGHNPYGYLLSNNTAIIVTDISDEYGKVDQIVDAHSLPYDNNYFNAIIVLEVLEHLEMPITAAKEFHRVLVNGGRIICSVPFMFHVHGDPHDYQRLTRNGILKLFSDFNSVKIFEIGGRIAVISDMLTTTGSIFTKSLRIFNNIFHLPILRNSCSTDCPSGYWVDVRK